MPIQYLETLEAFKTAINSPELVSIDFTATWCGPCKTISPVFEQLAESYTNCNFYKVDVDNAPEIVSECNITSMPTFKFYKNGVEITTFTGCNSQLLQETVFNNK